MRFVLASASSARLALLHAAGIEPTVMVSSVDEGAVERALGAAIPADLVAALARAKALDVVESVPTWSGPLLVLGCDSMLELDGVALGKPSDAEDAARRWRAMRGRSGVLHTGHHLVLADGSAKQRGAHGVASTVVRFADLSDDEVDAYVATGEPLRVAGAFTIDGRGGAFVDGIDGDHGTVVGLSLPLLRRLTAELGVAYTDLWT